MAMFAKDLGDAKELIAILKEQGKDAYAKKQKDGTYRVNIRGFDKTINLTQEQQREARRAQQIKYTHTSGEEEYVDSPDNKSNGYWRKVKDGEVFQPGRRFKMNPNKGYSEVWEEGQSDRPKSKLEDYSQEDFDKIVAKDIIEAMKSKPKTKSKSKKKSSTEPSIESQPKKPDLGPGEFADPYDTKEEVKIAARRAASLGAKNIRYEKDNLGGWTLYFYADDPPGEEIEAKLKFPPTEEEVEAGWVKEAQEKKRKRDIEEQVFEEAPATIESKEKIELEKQLIRKKVREKVEERGKGFGTIAREIGREKREKLAKDIILLPENIKKKGEQITREDLKSMTNVAASKRRVDVVGSQIQGVKGIKSGKHPLIGNGFGNVDEETGKSEQPKTRISQYSGNPRITEMGIGSSKGFADLSGLNRISGKGRNNPNNVDITEEEL